MMFFHSDPLLLPVILTLHRVKGKNLIPSPLKGEVRERVKVVAEFHLHITPLPQFW